MARRSSFTSTLIRLEREAQRARSQQVRAHAQAQAAQARAQVAQLRASAAYDREQRRLYLEARAAEATALNEQLGRQVDGLRSLLLDGLAWNPVFNFEQLKKAPVAPSPSDIELIPPGHEPRPEDFLPPELTGIGKFFGKSRYDRAYAESKVAFARATAEFEEWDRQRIATNSQTRSRHDAAEAETRRLTAEQHSQINELASAYSRGEPDQVVAVSELVLSSSPYPAGFEQIFKVAYVPESRQLVIEYELPGVDIVPNVKAYRYVKTNDSMTETARPATQIRSLYSDIVSQVTLRTLREIFVSDVPNHIETVVFNGVVDTVDPGSGRSIRPCLVTVRTTKASFSELNLQQVEPLACLRHLAASVSKSPADLSPVRPVLEFSMLDPRFVTESDAMSLLDERPNLLELSPTEFESLIQNLFARMGLEAKQTRPSRDGGVDCVAFDPRPIFGGKVIIQAKRYKNTVGVSAVRDLFGTLQNEGASKGILVTTSGYDAASFEFAKNKPLELLDGANLLYLLKTHADIDARIQAPDDWHDPRPDTTDA